MLKRYTNEASEPIVSAMLIEKGFAVCRSSSKETGYHLAASKDGVTVRIRIRHLQYDEDFSNSPSAHEVYKIKAFINGRHDPFTLQNVDFVVGYNPYDNSFACVPVNVYDSQGSARIYKNENMRHEYYNSWNELDQFIEIHTQNSK
ncbi:hypothetical protein GCM10008018_36580 [Paenibacillus marchantiophytorum]|uniref:PD(D/E)XK endonuclease domain-containing protein n=1 Tax=Paenibacillus marchantiophytorum TaxID=1619310 RepID=A0ABQ1ETU9_9BACL|nr:group I intron-associated PD-(D/E)XK endonuclease [Paenibacillus marchantiophytorum]GFZ87104.1 hypothetical protein GCM10008018_36580 [Paenibacillus marchantiophytorum]